MNIGKVVSIDFSHIKVKISSDIRGGSVNLNGNIYYFGNIGSYLKIKNSIDETIVCEVVSIFDSDFAKEINSYDVETNREVVLKPIGTIDKCSEFSLGVGIYPSLYSDVSIVTHSDLSLILKSSGEVNILDSGGIVHKSFSLGVSKNLINYPIEICIDSFFNIHSAVLGNSGSGKSNSVAHILQQIHSKKNRSALGSRIILFDVNGEYSQAFSNLADTELTVTCYKPNIPSEKDGVKPYYLPHFLLSLDEWSAFLLATDATQRPFWNRVLQESYRFYRIGTSDSVEQVKFVNYLRCRVCELVFGALRQADSDTARITTAASILGSITSIINSDEGLRGVAADLVSDITSLKSACTISYGENKDRLQKATEVVFSKVDIEKVNQVLCSKIKSGEYFDYKFLKIAAELILLEEDARGNKQIRGYTATMLTRLDYFLDNPDCEFMRESKDITSVDKFLDELWRNGDGKTHMVIIDTSELSPDILETLTSVSARLIFDQRKRIEGEGRRKNPVHLVLDEAHRYIKNNYEYILRENIFEKIAREGRKYSFYLLVSSQRPSELSETVLSQCANFIIHRIQNERDMHYIRAILPYFSDDFTNKIKQSLPGDALVFGNCVSMPLHLKIHKANPAPNSANCNVPEEWFNPS
ncbi:ATP-binding protein [Aurantivibrio infirmus]